MVTGSPDSMMILWGSLNSTTPTLQWGTTPGGPYSQMLSASTNTLEKGWLCGPPATTIGWFDVGLIHSVTITGLTQYAKQAIYYIYGDDATGNYASEHVLYLPPLPGDASLPTVMVTFGDLGRGTPDEAQTWWEYGRASYNTTNLLSSKEIAVPKGRGNGFTAGYRGEFGGLTAGTGAALNPTAGMHFLHHFGDIRCAAAAFAAAGLLPRPSLYRLHSPFPLLHSCPPFCCAADAATRLAT